MLNTGSIMDDCRTQTNFGWGLGPYTTSPEGYKISLARNDKSIIAFVLFCDVSEYTAMGPYYISMQKNVLIKMGAMPF